MRKLGLFFAAVGLLAMVVAHFADSLGLGYWPGTGADQLLGILMGAALLGFGLILLLTPSDLDNLALPPEARVPFPPEPRRRTSPRRLKHARHY
ncbi:MAG: hypothetical protein ABL998_03995 [Planctomycetota bacterium]